MTHDPLCPFAPWPDERCYQPDAGVSICSIIAKVRAVVLRMPSGAVMEIACAACSWDYGYESDLADLFGAYNYHIDNCPATGSERND